MLIKDLKKDFYDVIQHQRVLILVAFDVDALCACKILQYLLQCDHILYTIVPVSGRDDLEKAFVDNSEGIKHVIMINCCATTDIVEMLQPEENVCFYVCDSHRPVDVHNMYNAVQVKLLMKPEDLADVPDYDDVFRDESDDSGGESDGYEDGEKRRRFDDEAILRRQEKRKWEENRNKVLFDYSKFTSYGTSASLIMFELAWKMSKDTNDLVWLAIIGVTDQYVHFKTPRDKYMEDVMALQSHVSRHNHRGEDDENILSINCLRIVFDEELQLTLYRHWSLFESLCHSITTACRFRVWTLKGQKRLHEFLAEMGMPLTQCKQQFSAMDSNLRTGVKGMMQEHMTKYGLPAEDILTVILQEQYILTLAPFEVPRLTMQDIVLPSFSAQYGYKTKLCATDVVLACAAVLEGVDRNKSPTDNFLYAQDSLHRSNTEGLEKAVVLAKRQLTALVTQVQTFLDMHQIISAGPFLYVFVQEVLNLAEELTHEIMVPSCLQLTMAEESHVQLSLLCMLQGNADMKFFCQPQCLIRLARFTLEAHCSVSRSKRAPSLPLVLGAPMASDQGTMLVIGIPPLDTDDERKNFFGKAFEQAAASTNSRVKQDSFDSFIMEMKTEDRSKFFDALVNLLQ